MTEAPKRDDAADMQAALDYANARHLRMVKELADAEAEVARLTADKRLIIDERDSTFARMLARAEAAEAEVARLTELVRVSEGANDAIRTFWMDWAKKRLEITRNAYLRDAKLAIAGDTRALANRVALMELGPVQIVASEAE